MPTKCSGVPDSILNPANQWSDKADFDATLGHLADLYEVSSPAALRLNPFPARINLLPAISACRPLGTVAQHWKSPLQPAHFANTRSHLFSCPNIDVIFLIAVLLCSRRQTSANTPMAAALSRRTWLPASWPLAQRPRAPPMAPPRHLHGSQALWVVGWLYVIATKMAPPRLLA